MHAQKHTHTHTFTHICAHELHTHACTYTHFYTYMCTHELHTHAHTHVNAHTIITTAKMVTICSYLTFLLFSCQLLIPRNAILISGGGLTGSVLLWVFSFIFPQLCCLFWSWFNMGNVYGLCLIVEMEGLPALFRYFSVVWSTCLSLCWACAVCSLHAQWVLRKIVVHYH